MDRIRTVLINLQTDPISTDFIVYDLSTHYNHPNQSDPLYIRISSDQSARSFKCYFHGHKTFLIKNYAKYKSTPLNLKL